MKKISVAFISIILILSLMSCGEEPDRPPMETLSEEELLELEHIDGEREPWSYLANTISGEYTIMKAKMEYTGDTSRKEMIDMGSGRKRAGGNTF